MDEEKKSLEEENLDSVDKPKAVDDASLKEVDMAVDEMQSGKSESEGKTEVHTSAEGGAVSEETVSETGEQGGAEPPVSDESVDSEEKPQESTSQTEIVETTETGDERKEGTDIKQKDSKDEFFEKYKIPIIVGGAALLIIIALVLFLVLRKGDSKATAEEETTREIQTGIAKISYELYPFPNRSAKIGKLIPKLKKFEEELVEKIKSLPDDKKVIIYGHTSRERKKQISKKERGNEKLSTQRARAVIKYLVKKYNIDEERFEIKAIGSKELKVKNPTWSPRNRRVFIAVEE